MLCEERGFDSDQLIQTKLMQCKGSWGVAVWKAGQQGSTQGFRWPLGSAKHPHEDSALRRLFLGAFYKRKNIQFLPKCTLLSCSTTSHQT
ncbi:rCG49853 [Rattus norvegicus]|uniref:RCG49853 n=1 Tax=Rattus norvegicus TaxID=10116 RepID=A6K4G3_RAT|nr:rCG49853 [Rattus norvegicus]